MTEQPEYGPWIGWNGGDCPVDPNYVVQIIPENGLRQTDNACFVMWIGDNHVIAYRVKNKSKVVWNGHWDSILGDFYDTPSHNDDCRNVRITMIGDDIKAEWV